MTEKTNNKQKNKKIVLALVWNLRLGICDFRRKTPRQSRRTFRVTDVEIWDELQ
jgi:hypothetical protein